MKKSTQPWRRSKLLVLGEVNFHFREILSYETRKYRTLVKMDFFLIKCLQEKVGKTSLLHGILYPPCVIIFLFFICFLFRFGESNIWKGANRHTSNRRDKSATPEYPWL